MTDAGATNGKLVVPYGHVVGENVTVQNVHFTGLPSVRVLAGMKWREWRGDRRRARAMRED